MKTHYCLAEQAVITFEHQCNQCDEKEQNNERPIQAVFTGVLEPTTVSKIDDDFPIPIAPV